MTLLKRFRERFRAATLALVLDASCIKNPPRAERICINCIDCHQTKAKHIPLLGADAITTSGRREPVKPAMSNVDSKSLIMKFAGINER